MGDDVTARLAALEAKVRELDDIEQLRRLRNEYHQAINEGYYDRIPLMWTEDGSLDFSYIGQTQGREKITKFFAATPKVSLLQAYQIQRLESRPFQRRVSIGKVPA